MTRHGVIARTGVPILLAIAAACGSSGKPPLWQVAGALNHPFVQVTQTGAQMGMRTLDLRLEDCGLKVGRERPPGSAGADGGLPRGTTSLDIAEATCAQDEMTRGRALMTADLIASYQQDSATVTDDQRKARFVVVPPKATTSVSFVARADVPSAPFADLLAYVGELTARYQP